MASLYKRIGKYPLWQEMLLKINSSHPADIPSLMGLSNLFKRYRKYRVSLKLLDKAYKLNPADLYTLSELIRLNVRLKDKKAALFYKEKGDRVLKKGRFHKYRERFLRLDIKIDDTIILAELNNTGIFKDDGKRQYIDSGETSYTIQDGVTMNNQISTGDTVFFALYNGPDGKFVDFIEPYFTDIDNLEKLI